MSKFDNGPVIGGVVITPSAAALARPVRGFHVGVAGDVSATLLDGTTVLFRNCASGAYYPYACTHILASGTTAVSIVGLY